MGDEDDRAPFCPLALDHGEHLLGEVGGKRRGHLVEEQHLGPDGDGAGEIEDAEDGEGQVARRLAQVEIGHAHLAHPFHEGLDGRGGEAEVRRDVEIRDQRRLLVDGDEAGPARLGGRAHDMLAAVDEDAAAVRPDGAGEDLDEGRLAGAVGAHQGVDLAATDGERGIAQRDDGAVVLGDAGRLEKDVTRHVCPGAPRLERGRGAGRTHAPAVGPFKRLSTCYSPGPLQATIWSLV